MSMKEHESRSRAGQQKTFKPAIQPCFVWKDEDIRVEFPPTLAGNAMRFRQTYGEPGLGYSLRYGFFEANDVAPHFDLYVYDHGQYVPDEDGRIFQVHVAEMANALVAISDSRNPTASDGHFPNELVGSQFGKTGIQYLSIYGSYRNPGSGALFGTAVILFSFRGKFIKIRYSEPWSEKTPDTFVDTFERIESSLLEGRPTMFDRVGDFHESLDGLLFGSLSSDERKLLKAAAKPRR